MLINEKHVKTLEEIHKLLPVLDNGKSSSDLKRVRKSLGQLLTHIQKVAQPETKSAYLLSGSMSVATFAKCGVGSVAHYILNFKDRARYEVSR